MSESNFILRSEDYVPELVNIWKELGANTGHSDVFNEGVPYYASFFFRIFVEPLNTLQTIYSVEPERAVKVAKKILNQVNSWDDLADLIKHMYFSKDFDFAPIVYKDSLHVHHSTYIRNMSPDCIAVSYTKDEVHGNDLDMSSHQVRIKVLAAQKMTDRVARTLYYTSFCCFYMPGFAYAWEHHNQRLCRLVRNRFPDVPLMTKPEVLSLITKNFSETRAQIFVADSPDVWVNINEKTIADIDLFSYDDSCLFFYSIALAAGIIDSSYMRDVQYCLTEQPTPTEIARHARLHNMRLD